MRLIAGDDHPHWHTDCLPHQVILQYEVEDLRNASPATVSRAGIIYVSADDLGWEPMARSYLATRPVEEAKLLEPLFDKYVRY